MEVTLKRLSNNGTFTNEVLFLTQQKAYSFGRTLQNDFVLYFPTVEKNHCIIHHNSNGLFVEVLKSLAGVVVNGKKYTTGSMVRLNDKDLLEIGLFKYQVEIKPIVQGFHTETNFETHYERIKKQDLSDININNQSELKAATSDTHYQENWKSIRRDESFNSAVSMQIKIEEEDLEPLLPLNLTKKALTDPKAVVEFSRDPKTYFVSNERSEITPKRSEITPKRSEITPKRSEITPKQSEITSKRISDGIFHKQNIFKSPRELSKQNISNKENSFYSKNDDEPFLSKFNKNSIQTANFERETKTKILERLNIGNSKNTMKIFQTTTNQQLQHHLETHIEIFSCTICEKSYKTKSGLGVHMRSHSGLKPEICGICKRNLANKITLENHMQTHIYNGKFKCTKCFELFVGKDDLLSHMLIHRNAKNHKCSQCDKSYNCKSGLYKHVRKIHTRMGLLECNECNKVFLAKTEFEEHRRIHTGKKPFVCQVCEKAFRGRSALLHHISYLHADRKFTCNECQETFPNKYRLRRHLIIHFPENRNAWLKEQNICPECGHVAQSRSHLVSHRRVHTGEKPFQCLECNKSFARNCNLKLHMKIHTREYPYK